MSKTEVVNETTINLPPFGKVRVRFEYVPGSPGSYWVQDDPDELWFTEIMIDGVWESADAEFLDPTDIEKAQDALLQQMAETLRDDAAERQWEDQQDREYR